MLDGGPDQVEVVLARARMNLDVNSRPARTRGSPAAVRAGVPAEERRALTATSLR
jgi:hypothetical protein